MTLTQKIALNPKFSKRYLQGHPWVYSNELIANPKDLALSAIAPGSLVLLTLKDLPIAMGYYNRHSLIAFRTLARTKNSSPMDITSIDKDFFIKDLFIQKIQTALTLRTKLYSNPFYRLIHAESDGLPGLVIDRYDNVFIVQINTCGMDKLKDKIIEALQSVFIDISIDSTRDITRDSSKNNNLHICIQQDSSARIREGLPILPPEWIGEKCDIRVLENDIYFTLPEESAQKTGWFYDHRPNRTLIANAAKGKSLIDYYCYCGALALSAVKAGAKSVVGVDRSEAAIQVAKASAKANNLGESLQLIVSEVFADMDARIARNEVFDIVALDPPAFVKTKKDLAVGLKGYTKLITKGLQLTAKNGLLAVTSCSYHINALDLNACIAEALHKCNRSGKIIHKLSQGMDHPIHPSLPESDYLKGFFIAVD